MYYIWMSPDADTLIKMKNLSFSTHHQAPTMLRLPCVNDAKLILFQWKVVEDEEKVCITISLNNIPFGTTNGFSKHFSVVVVMVFLSLSNHEILLQLMKKKTFFSCMSKQKFIDTQATSIHIASLSFTNRFWAFYIHRKLISIYYSVCANEIESEWKENTYEIHKYIKLNEIYTNYELIQNKR